MSEQILEVRVRLDNIFWRKEKKEKQKGRERGKNKGKGTKDYYVNCVRNTLHLRKILTSNMCTSQCPLPVDLWAWAHGCSVNMSTRLGSWGDCDELLRLTSCSNVDKENEIHLA